MHRIKLWWHVSQKVSLLLTFCVQWLLKKYFSCLKVSFLSSKFAGQKLNPKPFAEKMLECPQRLTELR